MRVWLYLWTFNGKYCGIHYDDERDASLVRFKYVLLQSVYIYFDEYVHEYLSCNIVTVVIIHTRESHWVERAMAKDTFYYSALFLSLKMKESHVLCPRWFCKLRVRVGVLDCWFNSDRGRMVSLGRGGGRGVEGPQVCSFRRQMEKSNRDLVWCMRYLLHPISPLSVLARMMLLNSF